MKPLPEAQELFCINDRECSLRRYLEVINPSIETFGVAGFFGIDFLYQGLDDAYPVAQCPNIIVPKHLIKNVFRPGSKLPNIRSLIKEWLDNDWVRFVACHPSTRTFPVFH